MKDKKHRRIADPAVLFAYEKGTEKNLRLFCQ